MDTSREKIRRDELSKDESSRDKISREERNEEVESNTLGIKESDEEDDILPF